MHEYFPHLVYDENEEFFPTSFNWDDENLDNNARDYNASWPLYVYIHPLEYHWEDPFFGEKDFLVVQYWFYYCRDNKFWGIDIPLIGAHDHDWESVYVWFVKEDNDYVPDRITYFKHFAHTTIMWDAPLPLIPRFEKKNETHPVVHTALGSHASYERTIFGYGLFDFIKPPIPEPCDGGNTYDYEDFEHVFVFEKEPNWPDNFGDIDAPWTRERWNDLEYCVFTGPTKDDFNILGLHESGRKLYLHVYDNESRHVGFNNETSEFETEIPGSYCEDLGNTTFIILPTNITEFTIMVDATHAEESVEEYEITLITVRENEATDEESMAGTIEKGEQQQFDAELDKTGEIITIPEFPSFLILPLFMTATLLAVIVYRRKHST